MKKKPCTVRHGNFARELGFVGHSTQCSCYSTVFRGGRVHLKNYNRNIQHVEGHTSLNIHVMAVVGKMSRYYVKYRIYKNVTGI